MAPLSIYLVPLASLIPSLVSAHGHVTGIVADGTWYSGWNAEMKYQNPIPSVAGWQADNLDNGFISPSAFSSSDIICHKASKPGTFHIPAKPGSKITFQWNTWPVSHKGPVLDYLATCNGDCSTVSKEGLKFVKINEGAWKSGNDPGMWVTDDLVSANNSWTITLPQNLKSGNYVLRHEIIALHAAGQSNGAQAYPQCVNFKVEGSGTQEITGGVPATSFYKASDPGIQFNLYSKFTGYTIPGPALAKLKKREERMHARDLAA